MMKEDRRTTEERRDWLKRFKNVNAILNKIESAGRNNIDLETLAKMLNLPVVIINRIFGELKNDYTHRFPWLKDEFDISSEEAI
jgi:hypothetical protein